MKNIKKTVKDARIADALESGIKLSIDTLRDEVQSKDPRIQLKAFVKTFYFMKKQTKENEEQYREWFNDIKSVWKDKLSKLIPSLKITVDDDDLKFNGISARKNIKALDNKSFPAEQIIKQLDSYTDYKKVLRYFQHEKQQKAIDKQYNITYDESGDEPLKIVKGLTALHKKGYVVDVFLLHPENVASNIIQNYFRVIKGIDGGRDSSEVIVNAYLNIEKNKKYYKFNAEDHLKTSTIALQQEPVDPKIEEPLKNANVEDDKRRGNKPIDVFTEVNPMKPIEGFKVFNAQLDKDQQKVFMAMLKYRMLTIHNLPKNAKEALAEITKVINNKQALNILKKAAESKKYVFKWGGVTPELVKKAITILK